MLINVQTETIGTQIEAFHEEFRDPPVSTDAHKPDVTLRARRWFFVQQK